MARHIQSAPEQHKRRVQIDRITVQLLVKIGEECEAAGLDQGDIVVETRNRSIGPATLTNALTGCPAGDDLQSINGSMWAPDGTKVNITCGGVGSGALIRVQGPDKLRAYGLHTAILDVVPRTSWLRARLRRAWRAVRRSGVLLQVIVGLVVAAVIAIITTLWFLHSAGEPGQPNQNDLLSWNNERCR